MPWIEGLRQDLATKLNALGAGTNDIHIRNGAALWKVRQLSVITSPTASGATCTLTPPTGIIDTSYFAGTGDTAYGEYYLRPGDFIHLVWASGPANGTGICTFYYDEWTD